MALVLAYAAGVLGEKKRPNAVEIIEAGAKAVMQILNTMKDTGGIKKRPKKKARTK